MPKKRTKIPESTSANVIFKSDRACCICHKRIPFQINHINRDPSDNKEENLCVLCLTHHNQFESSSRISKGLSPELLRKYKREWEYTVQKRRKKKYGGFYEIAKSKQSQDLIKSQIELTSFEIMAIPDRDLKRLKERFDLLWHIGVFRGYSKEILTALHNIALISSMDKKNVAILLTEAVYNQFLHLIGPKDVEWDKEYGKNIIDGIAILTVIGEWNSEFNKKKVVIDSVCKNILKLFEISVWYNKNNIAKKIHFAVNSILKSSKEERVKSNKSPFVFAINRIKSLKESMKKTMKEYKRNWKYH